MGKNTVAVVIDAERMAMVRQYAKDGGYPSTSSALRRILDEWAMFKGAQARLFEDAGCAEERKAADGPRLV